jgi:predicted nucleic acid-binding protein
LFVDSGAWIALTSPRDQYHLDADRLFRAAAESRLRLITKAAENLSVDFATPEHHRAAREWLVRLADQPITYTDAVSFAVMKARRCRAALTFDRHFEIAGFERWRG